MEEQLAHHLSVISVDRHQNLTYFLCNTELEDLINSFVFLCQEANLCPTKLYSLLRDKGVSEHDIYKIKYYRRYGVFRLV